MSQCLQIAKFIHPATPRILSDSAHTTFLHLLDPQRTNEVLCPQITPLQPPLPGAANKRCPPMQYPPVVKHHALARLQFNPVLIRHVIHEVSKRRRRAMVCLQLRACNRGLETALKGRRPVYICDRRCCGWFRCSAEEFRKGIAGRHMLDDILKWWFHEFDRRLVVDVLVRGVVIFIRHRRCCQTLEEVGRGGVQFPGRVEGVCEHGLAACAG